MKNLSTMSLSQLQDIKFILTDIDDTLTSDGRLKSNAYEAMERLSDNGYSVIPVTGRCAGWCDHIARCGQLMASLVKMELSFLAMIMSVKK
jgi:predicted mannosyl-3-phosphoglycerate phosphatase (HAD superfamily)